MYVRVRNGAGVAGLTGQDGNCLRCQRHSMSALHVMWQCTSTKHTRLAFWREATAVTPGIVSRLSELPPQEAFHFVMGAGARSSPEDQWCAFQALAVLFVARTFEHNRAGEGLR